MALNWEWKNKIGTAKLVQEQDDGTFRRFKIDLYRCNGLFVACYHYKQDGRKVYDLVNFACDKEHFKRCLGLSKGYDNIYRNAYSYYTAWKLNAYYSETWTMAKLLVEAGFTVTMFTKSPKEKKHKNDD